MSASFRNILIPVDFSINTEVAIKKCLEIIETRDSSITLFHVERSHASWDLAGLKERFVTSFPRRYYQNESRAKLMQWQGSIQENFPEIKVRIELVKARHIENTIIDKATQAKPDILIVGKKSHHRRLSFGNSISPGRMATKTGIPVLTVKPGSIYSKTRSIVVPVGSSMPARSLDLILALRKKLRISIHLVTVMKSREQETEFSADALLSTYRFLKDVAQCPLGYEVLHGEDIAKSTLRYAQRIKADMLLAAPEKESGLGSFFSKHISDELLPESRLQILTVQP